jgi:3-hydroxybutyrate dehydrogenase
VSAPLGGRVAFISGSAGGIGLAIGQALGALGCRVALHGIEPEADVAATLAAFKSRGVDACYCRADFRQSAEVMRALDDAQAHLGPIDILVNNAVTRHIAPIERFPVAAWDDALAINLSAPFHAIRHLLPGMRARGFGRIVNMTSVYAVQAVAERIDYSTTKAAISGMTRAVAAETASSGITCNAVCPGSVLTPGIEARLQKLMAETGLARAAATAKFLEGKQPGGQFIPPEHVADLVAFLCGASAAGINGATYTMDCGWSVTT